MRPCCTKDKHGLRVRHHEVECPNVSLAVFEWDVAAVHATFKGRAWGVESRLRGGMVAGTELELDDVADRSDERVGGECVLGTAYDDRVELVLAGSYGELDKVGGGR